MAAINKKYAFFQERRTELVLRITKRYPHVDKGKIVLFANFERDGYSYQQDGSFYYYTGIDEPAAVVSLDIATGFSTLFIPNFGEERLKWIADALVPSQEKAHELGFDALEYLGKRCSGYQCHPFFTHHEYENILTLIQEWLDAGYTFFTLNPGNASEYIEQRFVLQRIVQLIPSFETHVIDISAIVARMRRKKSKQEIELLYKAIEITINAHESAVHVMGSGKKEYELQAAIEYQFINSGGSVAFSTIVASGKNSTILHYTDNQCELNTGDLVVIDIGARYKHYCADITRTYPVSGSFTSRQREIYELVLEAQLYIAQLARPGMWLSNKNKPEQSLNHLARTFLSDRGYGEYFVHGIGHFLGLDVHDVGDYLDPLESGDVITIEPGIYIPEESLGVRIEDDYWLIPDGVICLSENLPKHSDDIEKAVVYAQQENTAKTE